MLIDIFCGLAIILGFFQGYSKGIIKTIFSILSILLGIIAAMKLSPLTIGVMESVLPNYPRLSYILGFLLTFLIVIIIIRFIGNKLESLFKAVKINFVNKMFGGILTATFFLVIFSTIVWFLNEARLISEQQKDQSITYYHIEPIPSNARRQFEAVKPVFQTFWDKTLDTFEKAKEKGIEIQNTNG
ncbi:CvpA family protein [Saprospiraceae bacterium]|nr:CvpA family protein [Saprospiraceae bacterium]